MWGGVGFFSTIFSRGQPKKKKRPLWSFPENPFSISQFHVKLTKNYGFCRGFWPEKSWLWFNELKML